MPVEWDLEIVEEYILMGERRYRVKVKGAKLVVNVAAGSREEALRKAREILERVKADRVLKNEGS